MIHEIDAPVGQVNVAVHTVQVNGEHGDRMEPVEQRIQTYIDHSRFLTLQSAEMLRKAVVKVAAIKAAECNALMGVTQEDRDRKYLYSFFGADFIEELIALDSEFLHTGNKLLSLHSMDSTSLQAAMFLMALAKNSTRMAILSEFEQMTATALPMAEERYLEAELSCDCPHKMLCKHRHAFQLLAGNARFESLRGMFDAEIVDDDTMTPVQREFLKLAQILKSRLVVELEINQRVMERAVIEERGITAAGNAIEDVQAKERLAKGNLKLVRTHISKTKRQIAEDLTQLMLQLDKSSRAAESYIQWQRQYEDLYRSLSETKTAAPESAERNAKGATTAPGRTGILMMPDGRNMKYSVEKGKIRLSDPQSEAEWESRFHQLYNQTLGLLEGADSAAIEGVAHEQTRQGLTALMKVDLGQNAHTSAANVIQLIKAMKEARPVAEELIRSNRREMEDTRGELSRLLKALDYLEGLVSTDYTKLEERLGAVELATRDAIDLWTQISAAISDRLPKSDITASSDDQTASNDQSLSNLAGATNKNFSKLVGLSSELREAILNAAESRRPLDHKKFLDMLIDDMEDKFVELLEGTRAHTANIDAYIKRLVTSLNDDFNTQFYYPAFRQVRRASRMWDVTLGQIETTSILANNRSFAKVSPQATMEFDLPKRDIVIAEAMNGAKAAVQDFGALVQDPAFLSLAKLNSGQSTATPAAGATGGLATVRDVLPGLSTDTAEQVLAQHGPGNQKLGSALESLIPDPAVYKFETGTGYEIRPVIQPDGQAVVFHLNYMYTTNVREPVRPDEKHLGRVKRHFIDTDVQLSNYELREVSRYQVALKASRTSQGVPLLQDIPIAGILFRPLPSAESSLQENLIMAQATIFPTLFDLMGLRWAPAVADLDPLRLENDEFIVRSRRRAIMNRVYDYSSGQVDAFLRIPEAERRSDLYRSQETIPAVHPNGYEGPGLNLRDSQLEEGFDPPTAAPSSRFIPSENPNGSRSRRPGMPEAAYPVPWDPHSDGPMPEGSDRGRTFGAEPVVPILEDAGEGAEAEPLPPPSGSTEGRRSHKSRLTGGKTISRKSNTAAEHLSVRRSAGVAASSRTAVVAPEEASAKGPSRRTARKRTSNPTR